MSCGDTYINFEHESSDSQTVGGGKGGGDVIGKVAPDVVHVELDGVLAAIVGVLGAPGVVLAPVEVELQHLVLAGQRAAREATYAVTQDIDVQLSGVAVVLELVVGDISVQLAPVIVVLHGVLQNHHSHLIVLGEAEGCCLGELGYTGGHDVDGGLLHPGARRYIVRPGSGATGGVQVAPVPLLFSGGGGRVHEQEAVDQTGEEGD